MQLEVLVERFKQKDVKAFEKLHGMYAENICGVINTIVRDEDLAQEICQDVFIKIWNGEFWCMINRVERFWKEDKKIN